MSLVVTGSIGIDHIETPTRRAAEVLGGSATYFCAAAGFFGPVRLIGAVGDDFPAEFIKVYRRLGLDLAGLERRAGSKTFRWHGRYHQNMNQRDTLEVQLNVLAERLPPVPPAYRDSRFVFLANTHPAGQLELLANFPHRRLAVADTMDLWINNEKPALLKLLRRIDGLVLNDSEAQLLTGQTNLIRAGEAVLKLGPGFTVIKKGEHGAILVARHARRIETIALPAWPAREVIDPTGAGDSFAGGMIGVLAQRHPTGRVTAAMLKTAMAYGTIIASFTIEDFGPNRLTKLTRREINQRVKLFAANLTVKP